MRFVTCSFALLVACSAGPSAAADTAADAPVACVQDVISMGSSASPGNPAYSVFECSYRGATAYYVPAQCCDQFSVLFDASCEVICAPDGGITGGGDGRCADFDSATCTLLWRDPRGI